MVSTRKSGTRVRYLLDTDQGIAINAQTLRSGATLCAGNKVGSQFDVSDDLSQEQLEDAN